MTRPELKWRYYASRLGTEGLVGLAIFSVAAIVAIVTLSPLQKEIADLKAKVAEIGRPLPEDAASPPMSRPERMQMFHEFFPKGGELGYWIGRIKAAADEEKVVLERADYRFSNTGDPPVPLRIAMPVKGSYSQVRRFINAALMEVPAMALEEFSLVRQTAKDQQVEAQLQFVVYVRSGK